jgi:MFS family permease
METRRRARCHAAFGEEHDVNVPPKAGGDVAGRGDARAGASTEHRAPLTGLELVRISLYWLALAGVWACIGFILLPDLAEMLICPAGITDVECAALERHELAPIALGISLKPEEAIGILALVGSVVAFVVQPVAAALSDYTRSRLGRRRPWIIVGTALDVLFLVALYNSQTFLALAVLIVLLQFSSNLAQGPFQGYVPDLVPERQVGTASGLMGTMSVSGVLVGAGIGAAAVWLGNLYLAFVALAVLEVATMLPAVFRVADRPVEMPRRSGTALDGIRGAIVESWGHRSFVWLLVSRFFILMTVGTVNAEAKYFLERSIGYSNEEAATAILVLLGLTVLTAAIVAVWAGRASDRFGRRRLIWAGCLVGALGMVALAVAPAQPEFVMGAVRFPLGGLAAIPIGIGSGMFLAVDWALMVDIIPRATAGRYMGISNVVTATSGAIAATIAGFVIAEVSVRAGDPSLGPRVAIALTLTYYALGAWALRRVDTRPYEVQMAESGKSQPVAAVAA